MKPKKETISTLARSLKRLLAVYTFLNGPMPHSLMAIARQTVFVRLRLNRDFQFVK